MARFIIAAGILLAICGSVYGNEEKAQSATGSSDIIVEGQAAKRAGDISAEDAIYSPDVFFNGKPVITGCRNGVPVTHKSLIVNGKPLVLRCEKSEQ